MSSVRYAGACDCHMHVLGSKERYRAAPGRLYTPTEMPFDAYLPMATRLGLERVVLVQPSAYGADNSCMLDAMQQRPREAARGVVVIDADTPDEDLAAMHALGVRGVRLNLMTPRLADASAAARLLEPVAGRIADLGWHVQIYADPGIIAPIAGVIRSLSVPVVLDHMGGARSHLDPKDAQFLALVDLLARGACWVKLSGADIVTGRDDEFSGAAPFARALIAANPDRLLWGTDWPHLVHFHGATGDDAPLAGYRPVDEDALLRLLIDCAGDEDIVRRILVDNPARLYGFAPLTGT